MESKGLERPAVTVTAEYSVRLHRPTPMGVELHLTGRATEITGRKISVEAELNADGVVTASCRGLFIAVKEGHPAAAGW